MTPEAAAWILFLIFCYRMAPLMTIGFVMMTGNWNMATNLIGFILFIIGIIFGVLKVIAKD